jgi:copper homeostasis protein CutC
MTNDTVQALNYLNKIQSEALLTEGARISATNAIQAIAAEIQQLEKKLEILSSPIPPPPEDKAKTAKPVNP